MPGFNDLPEDLRKNAFAKNQPRKPEFGVDDKLRSTDATFEGVEKPTELKFDPMAEVLATLADLKTAAQAPKPVDVPSIATKDRVALTFYVGKDEKDEIRKRLTGDQSLQGWLRVAVLEKLARS